MNFDKKEASVKNAPVRTDISIPVQEQLIVELYSK
jgi:ribosomal protein S4